MPTGMTQKRHVFLSTELIGPRAIRFAQVGVLASMLFFLAAVPFAKEPLAQFPVFIPIYVSSLIICDLMTAVLLFGQYNFLRARGLLVLAGGYLFTASITTAYALIFPGLFSPTGLLGPGPQTTSAMYMFWHSGFPLAVIGYALLKNEGLEVIGSNGQPRPHARRAIIGTIAGVLALVIGYTVFATLGHDYIPVFLLNNHTTDLGHTFLFGVWLLSILALFVLWRRKPHTVLDVWMMVVLCVWLCDIALAAILNTGRYDVGWYTGRIYGLLAAAFLLIVLLFENGANYARLAQLSVELGDANKALEQLSMHDALTGLANRRFFDTYLADQIAIARRHQRTLALVMCDVDSFKPYNDHYGHQAGDECLKQVAAAVRACCRRPADLAARYGGEEFAMVLPDTDLAGATKIAEAAREAVSQLCIPHAHSPASPCVSISGGVAVALLLWTKEMTAQQLITAADQVLYQAKGLGRNRIISLPLDAKSNLVPSLPVTSGS
jgi:diguanylate cyclase (GGDEF)-like protein